MADFTISPGIVSNEIDQSIRSTTVSTGSVAGVIGEFNWGPAMIPTLVKDELDLVDQFGEPTQSNHIEWFNGKNYLDYAEDLNVVRVVDPDTAMNATFATNNPVYSPNEEYYTEKLIAEEGGLRDSSISSNPTNPAFGMGQSYGGWVALYPGERGNSLRVEMCFATERTHAIGLRDAANTSNYVNEVEFSQNTALGISGNRYIIDFKHNDGFANNSINFMNPTIGYFENRTDILATDNQANQEKVVTFTRGGVTYNMLIESERADGTLIGYVNQGDGTVGMAPTVVSFLAAGDELKQLTIRERSMYAEYSTGASRDNKDNLLGKVYYRNNAYTIYGQGTAFTRQVAIGDMLEISSQLLEVTAIISDTELTVATPIIGATIKTLVDAFGVEYDVINATPWIRRWKYATYFNGEPATSSYIRLLNNNDLTGNYNDQMHMVVVDSDGLASGLKGRVLESYGYLSLARDGKDENKVPNYYVNRINSNSRWVRWTNHIIKSISTDGNWGSTALGTKFDTYNKNSGLLGRTYAASTFSGGSNGGSVDDDSIARAINIFKAKELWELDFFIVGWTNKDIDYQIAASRMIQVVEERKDAVVCVSPEYYKTVLGKPDSGAIAQALVDWRQGVVSSSYGIMAGNFKYQYDNYNDTFRWLPMSGDVAGLMGRTDVEFQPWYSPAGYVRGSIKNVIKLAFNPTQAERDLLYISQINPIMTIRGEGTMLFGDKTLQTLASAFDRINVRRLFISVKDFVVRQARLRLFEFNTPTTRAAFKRNIETYLTFVQGEQGLSDFRVICDETNNTNAIIEENRFVADIYIKPTYVINFIKLNFTAVGQSVAFEDLGV